MEEIWKDIPGYEGLYQASNLGRVRNMKFGRKRLLRTKVSKKGYVDVCLSKSNVVKTHRLHKIVTLTFLGQRPEGLEVNHIDGDKKNNCIDNLEYVTRSENELHAFKFLGKKAVPPVFYGEDHPSHKLSQEKVNEIRILHQSGWFSASRLGRMYKVSKTAILNIVKNKAWASS